MESPISHQLPWHQKQWVQLKSHVWCLYSSFDQSCAPEKQLLRYLVLMSHQPGHWLLASMVQSREANSAFIWVFFRYLKAERKQDRLCWALLWNHNLAVRVAHLKSERSGKKNKNKQMLSNIFWVLHCFSASEGNK